MRSAVAPEWRDRLARAGLADLRKLLEPDLTALPGRWELLSKPGLRGRRRWRWELPGDGQSPVTLYVKQYERTRLVDQLDRIRRQSAQASRARWEYEQSAALAAQSVPAVRTIAMIEDMRGLIERRSAVVFASVAGDGLDRMWRRFQQAGAPLTRGSARHDLIRRLGRFIRAFHQTGLCHRDLYLCHVFAELDPAGRTPPQFTLIDLARLHRPRWRRMRWVIKDLAQLDASAQEVGASRADRLRFLRAYLESPPGAPRVRKYARGVARKSRGILRRIARQSRGAT